MPSKPPEPYTRRQVLLVTSGAVVGCNPERAPAPDAGTARRSLASFPSRREFHHGSGLVVMVPLGAIQANCYVVVDSPSSEAVVVDPGGEPEAIAAYVEEAGLRVAMILATHGHIDHVAGVAPLQRLLGVPFAMHVGDRPGLARIPDAGRMYGYPRAEAPTFDRDLAAIPTIPLGDATIRVLPTPGHSPGSCCLHVPQWRIVLTGDTLFRRSVGRADLPGGSQPTLFESIRSQLYVLDDDVVAYCGHEAPTSIGQERRLNPFVRS